MNIDLSEMPQNIVLGTIRIRAYKKDGKDMIEVSALNMSDALIIMPNTNNKVTIKADKKI